MTNPRILPSLVLAAVLLAACAPATASVSPVQPVTVEASATLPPSPTLETAPTEAPAPTVIPIATSRGPNLEATDPTTVSMVSGGLQFVEFFEFW